MLLRSLLARDSARPETHLAFKSRGVEVSRLEGFSDAVVGFAITLLVISAKMPGTSVELLAMGHAVLPFIASFIVLFSLWRGASSAPTMPAVLPLLPRPASAFSPSCRYYRTP